MACQKQFLAPDSWFTEELELKMWAHSLLFCMKWKKYSLWTSSCYDDTQQKMTGGREENSAWKGGHFLRKTSSTLKCCHKLPEPFYTSSEELASLHVQNPHCTPLLLLVLEFNIAHKYVIPLRMGTYLQHIKILHLPYCKYFPYPCNFRSLSDI